MLTIIEKIDPDNIDMQKIGRAANLIKSGELVAFPTETVYGLGGDALNPESSKKIYAAKGRPSDNPLIVHIADIDALRCIARNIPDAAYKIAEAFWPGPLTMILNKTKTVPYETTGGLDTVAVRMPSDSVAAAFIRLSGGFVAAPSANTSGRPSPTTADHVKDDLYGKIAMILDAGPVNIGLESTIIDLTGKEPMILRPGYITNKMLSGLLGSVNDDPALTSVSPDAHPKAPGMKYRHYAPKADMIIVDGEAKKTAAWINNAALELHMQGKRTGVICTDETLSLYNADEIRSAGSRDNEDEISRRLYSILREFDELNVDMIYSENFNTPRLGDAIMNRLQKAAAHNIIKV